jgi:hypothetical protein
VRPRDIDLTDKELELLAKPPVVVPMPAQPEQRSRYEAEEVRGGDWF